MHSYYKYKCIEKHLTYIKTHKYIQVNKMEMYVFNKTLMDKCSGKKKLLTLTFVSQICHLLALQNS